MNEDIFEENYFKQEDFEFHEEITEEYDVDCERTEDKGVHWRYLKQISIIWKLLMDGMLLLKISETCLIDELR